jgi:hypothetical protein
VDWCLWEIWSVVVPEGRQRARRELGSWFRTIGGVVPSLCERKERPLSRVVGAVEAAGGWFRTGIVLRRGVRARGRRRSLAAGGVGSWWVWVNPNRVDVERKTHRLLGCRALGSEEARRRVTKTLCDSRTGCVGVGDCTLAQQLVHAFGRAATSEDGSGTSKSRITQV